jgi:hypothetical protein
MILLTTIGAVAAAVATVAAALASLARRVPELEF